MADFAPDVRAYSSLALGSAVDRRAYFLLLRQKKVAKEKATPTSAVGYADCPALLEEPGGCGTRAYGPQTVLADSPRPFCVARRCRRGPTNQPHKQLLRSATQNEQKPKSDALRSVFNLPSAASSSAGRPGTTGEDCLRAAAPSSAAPRGDRAAQRTRRSRATQRARPFFAYFLSARRKKVMSPVNGEKQPTTKPNP